jgi:hypothetical protein
MRYWLNLAIGFDQLINALLLGYADETLSARLYRNKDVSIYWFTAYKLVNLIFFLQKDHCYSSYLSERDRKHLPSHYSE